MKNNALAFFALFALWIFSLPTYVFLLSLFNEYPTTGSNVFSLILYVGCLILFLYSVFIYKSKIYKANHTRENIFNLVIYSIGIAISVVVSLTATAFFILVKYGE